MSRARLALVGLSGFKWETNYSVLIVASISDLQFLERIMVDNEMSEKEKKYEQTRAGVADRIDKDIAQLSKQKAIVSFISLIVLLVATIGIISIILINSSSPDVEVRTGGGITFLPSSQQLEFNALKLELDKTKGDLRNLQQLIQEVSQTPNQIPTALQIKSLSNVVSQTQRRIDNLEGVILDNPSKAIALPLLKKDLDGLRENYQVNSVSVKTDIDRIYDFNKWFIGLMAASLLSVVGLAVANLFKKG